MRLTKLNHGLRFILGLDSHPLPLNVRLRVIWQAATSRINFNREHSTLVYPEEESLLEQTKFRSLGEFATHIRQREAPSFFSPIFRAQARESTVATLERIFPEAKRETLLDAERIIGHTFDLLGSGPVRVTYGAEFKGDYQPIDWHSDFKSGHKWDIKTLSKDIRYGDVQRVDVKVPWELSRFQHLPTLGKAYWLTRNEKYAREFVNEINDWVDNNPPEYGVNWACTMDVAIRAVNWLWGFYFFRDSPAVSDEFLLKLVKNLYTHGKFITRNLERSLTGINSNHYLSDLVGLVYIGVLLPEFKETHKWREFGTRELTREMKRQVYNDGVDYEGSVSYHRLETELFLSATLLCIKNGIIFPDWYMQRLERMVEFIKYYTKPDGAAPQIGDNDDGRLHILSNYGNWDRLDHRYLLSIGAALFHRPDFKQSAEKFPEEAFWLLGQERLETFNGMPTQDYTLQSKAFPHGGFYVMGKDSLYAIVDCVPPDPRAPSGHKHNSRLSFELSACGKNFIVDPGAYIYTPDKNLRNLFRSTKYHNTVVVDGEEQNRFNEDELFRIELDTSVKVNKWQVTEKYDLLDAEHSGYARLKESVIHQRQIFFDKIGGYWVIKDTLRGEGSHQFDLYFHFAPMEIKLDDKSPLVVKTKTNGANLAIIPLETDGVSAEILEGWVSCRYGIKIRAPIVKYSQRRETPVSFCNVCYPYIGETDTGKAREEALRIINLNRLFG